MPELPLLGGLPAVGLRLFLTELAITVGNPDVWRAIVLALILGAGCWVFGAWVARAVGLLSPGARAGETLGVGLASGLMVIAAWWAAVWSAGRSSFAPVAVGFAIALLLALLRRAREPSAGETLYPASSHESPRAARSPRTERYKAVGRAGLAGAAFVVGVALLYGSTMAPSPRDGVQPVEFSDEAYYAVLGRDLATTGTETNLFASGFAAVPGLPAQTWYHWGELWLAAPVITVFGVTPIAARYFIVLPILLLAAAAMTGTLVRRIARTGSRRAYAFGFLACLFLAPMPVPGPFFSSWAVGMVFGITLYGLSVISVLLALYGAVVLAARGATWSLVTFLGNTVAFTLPAHIVIAALTFVGVGAVWSIGTARSALTRRRLPRLSAVWHRPLIASVIFSVITFAWGAFTGHGLGGSAATPNVSPFNAAWAYSVAFTYMGAGVLLAIPVAALVFRNEAPTVASICLGTAALVLVGAIGWGARLADFNMFHVFFGGTAVFAAPVGAVAVWTVIERLRKTRRPRLATVVAALCAVQLGVGVASAMVRLQEFGPRLHNEPIAVALLDAIRQLPADAKLAYACRPFEEISFVDSSLLSIDAHTGRRVIPMCFEADVFSTQNGVRASAQVPAAGFAFAPQSELYPDAAAAPSSAAIIEFLKEHGIGYIYADAQHLNTLVPDAIPLASAGDGQVLRLP